MKRKDNKYKNRLLKLADFLDKLPRKRFNFNSWVGNDWDGKEGFSCGTTACALGWATTIPAFRKLGLRMHVMSSILATCSGYVSLKNKTLDSYLDSFDSACNAAKKIFGIDENEFWKLFVPDEGDVGSNPGKDATPKQVAKHIRKFVKEKYG